MTEKRIKSEKYQREFASIQVLCAVRPYRKMFEFFNFPRATVHIVLPRDTEIQRHHKMVPKLENARFI
jgi:hypothetical protein